MADSTLVARGGNEHGRALNRYTIAILVAYLVFVIGMMVTRRSTVTPDGFALLALAVACILGRGRTFVRDWLPFIAILVAWQAMRGLVWQAGFTVQSDSVVAVERFCSSGPFPARRCRGSSTRKEE